MNDNIALKSILLVAANPKGTVSLRLQEEEREIKERLRLAGYGKVPISSTGATRPRDIQQAMVDFKPQIVHFTGHGAGQDGLAFEDVSGKLKLVDSEALANLFKLFSNRVECVVLNACYSKFQAEAIAQHIDYVIGMSQAIGDRAAIEFTIGFYIALGAGESIEFAYGLGCNAIQLEGIPGHLTPVLCIKKDGSINTNHQRSLELGDADIAPIIEQVSPPLKNASNKIHTRRQFFKLAIPIGIGVIGISALDQFFKHQFQQNTNSTSNNYSNLEGFLKAKQWKKANQETGKLLFQAAKKDNEGWLDREAINIIPCNILSKIDELWLENSDQRFGFGVQKEIYFECGGEVDKYDEKIWECVGDRIRWRLKGNWLSPDEVIFDSSAPVGHLPFFRFWVKDNSGYWWGVILMSRLVNCGS